MPNIIKHKRSNSSGAVPTLSEGELALNLVDRRIFTANSTATFDALANVSSDFSISNNSSGALRVGNSSVNTVVNSTSIVLANSTSNTRISIPSTSQFSATNVFLHANGSWVTINTTPTGNVSPISAGTTRITNSPTVIDSMTLTANVVTVEYSVSLVDNTNNNRRSLKITAVANTTLVDSSEYASVSTNNSANVAVLSLDISGGNLRLLGTGESANVDVSFIKLNIGPSQANGGVGSFFVNTGGGGGGLTIGGSTNQVQFNDAGSLNGTAGFTFDKTSNNLFIGNNISLTNSLITGNSTVNSVLSISSLTLANSTTNTAIKLPSSVEYSGQFYLHANGSWVQPVKRGTAEIDFGSSGTFTKTFTITDANVTSDSMIFVSQSAGAATGRQADENELESLQFSVLANSGNFTLIASNKYMVSGKYKINYLIG